MLKEQLSQQISDLAAELGGTLSFWLLQTPLVSYCVAVDSSPGSGCYNDLLDSKSRLVASLLSGLTKGGKCPPGSLMRDCGVASAAH